MSWTNVANITGPPGSGGGGTDVASLSLPNVFQREDTFSGIRFGDITLVTAGTYTALPTDCVILCDCTTSDVIVNLPPAVGNGQSYRIRRIDSSTNQVRIRPATGETIDGITMVALIDIQDRVLITDILPQLWDLATPLTLADTAEPNTFPQPTTLKGLRLGSPLTKTDDYVVQSTDTEILVDCSVLNKDINITLPLANATGQLLHIKKIDSIARNVIISTQGSPPDLIDGSSSLSLGDPGADALLIAGDVGYWDNTGPTMDNVMFFPWYGTLAAIGADQGLYIFNPDQTKFHLLQVRGAAGAEYITIGPGVTQPP